MKDEVEVVEVVEAAPVEAVSDPVPESAIEETEPSEFEKELQAVYTEPDDDDAPSVEKDEEEAKESVDSEQDSGEEDSDASEEEAPQISDELLARGEAAGLTAEDVQKLVDAGLAEKLLPPLDNTDGRSEQQDAEQNAEPEPPTDWPEIPDLDPDEYDEAVVNSFNGLKQQNKALRETLGAVQQQLGAIFAVNMVNQMDQWMGEKPEYREVLGTGNLDTITPEVAAKRVEVLAKMDALAAGYMSSGKPQPPQKQIFDEAFMAIHGRTLVKSAGDKAKADIKAKLQKQKKSFDLKPTAREALSNGTLTDHQKATYEVAKKMGRSHQEAMREAQDASDGFL